MLSQDQEEQYGFENSVRATARMLWNEAALGGSTNFDGRERDGYFETRDTVHIVEATTSTRKQKVVDDGKKTHEAVIKIRRNTDKFAQGWLITKNEPTADQRDAVKEKYSSTTQIMSFDQFRSRLFDGNQYLTQRSKYRFGSILDFSDNSVFVPENEYVDVDFLNESRTKTIPHTDVISSDYTRKLFLVLGEYGSGKSMSLRAAFISRRSDYFSGKRIRCPIYLNLRDHVGQTSPIEALERHARAIGYAGPANDLVRAWRAGFVDLFLDGFDEMATAGWGGSIHKVRSHRYAGMALVRQFLSESQESADIYLAGRENYFDSASEMKSALGISTKFHVVRTAEFSSSELSRFLVKKHFTGTFPQWLPARPLLISYLFSQKLIGQIDGAQNLDEAKGWDSLLHMIAEREASQDSRLDPYTVRNIIERLSTLARRTADGLGQIDVTTIQAVFQEFAGFPPDEGAQQFLLRLPGLAPSSREDGSRTFVDRALADAAKAGDVVRFIEFPYGGQVEIFSGAISSVGGLGRGVILAQILNKTITGTQIIRAVEIASETNDCQQICPDLLYCYMILNDNVEFDAINIRGVTEDNLDFMIENSNIRNITFSDSMFSNISIDTDYPVADLPVFKSCIIGSLSGIYGEDNLPSNFIDPDIAEYSDTISTNADIFSASLPEPTKVLVSVLRKLFLQAGAGRQETAFTRGAMDARTKKLVPEVLSRIQAQGFADRTRMRGNWIWHPNRSRSHEARSIIFSPSNSEHPLAISVRDLS